MATTLVVVCAISTPACSDDDARYVANVDSLMPTMTSVNVDTYVSDSGYVKYHAVTPIWDMYDDTSDPYWDFPEGIILDTYNPGMKPNAHVECDSAIYRTARRLFRLDGNVVAVNVEGDTFLTQQLYWDQAKTEFHTDSFIHIVRADRIIEGYGFTSNEQMTQYVVHNPTAIIPASTLRKDRSDSTNTTTVDTSQAVPTNTAPRRAISPAERTASRHKHRKLITTDNQAEVSTPSPRNTRGSVTNMK